MYETCQVKFESMTRHYARVQDDGHSVIKDTLAKDKNVQVQLNFHFAEDGQHSDCEAMHKRGVNTHAAHASRYCIPGSVAEISAPKLRASSSVHSMDSMS